MDTVAAFIKRARGARPAFVDGKAGAAWIHADQLRVVFRFTVRGDRISRIDLVADPESLAGIDLAVPEEPPQARAWDMAEARDPGRSG
jgi:hypothetical protein